MSVVSIVDTRQYLTFKLGTEIFAMDVSNVREILEFTTVTKVPGTPDYMRGAINLRGSVVPVVDMRLKFGLPVSEKTVHTCIIVVEVAFEGDTSVIGALVDSVQEVFELEPEQIEPPPKIGTQLRTGFVKGMGKRDDGFIIVLDVDKVFSSDELLAMEDGEADRVLDVAGNEW
jgi:purine-binding chemotaxis protein CheW